MLLTFDAVSGGKSRKRSAASAASWEDEDMIEDAADALDLTTDDANVSTVRHACRPRAGVLRVVLKSMVHPTVTICMHACCLRAGIVSVVLTFKMHQTVSIHPLAKRQLFSP